MSHFAIIGKKNQGNYYYRTRTDMSNHDDDKPNLTTAQLPTLAEIRQHDARAKQSCMELMEDIVLSSMLTQKSTANADDNIRSAQTATGSVIELPHIQNKRTNNSQVAAEEGVFAPSLFEQLVELPEPIPTRTPQQRSTPGAFHMDGIPTDHQNATSNEVPTQNQQRQDGGIPSNLPVASGVDVQVSDSLPRAELFFQRSKQYWRQQLCLGFSMELTVVLLGISIFLVVFLITKDGEVSTTSESRQSNKNYGAIHIPAAAPGSTQAPTPFLDALNLPDYTVDAIQEHPRSPQSKAYHWLVSNTTHLAQVPKWRTTQRFALATFFFSTRGDFWVNHHGWLDWEVHECNWEQQALGPIMYSPDYMPCDDSGNIKGLSFIGNKLDGTIPPELSLLSADLELLALPRNMELKGWIPTEIGLLTKLTELRTFNTKLSGTVPTELGLLSDLRFLELGGAGISGTVPKELGNLGCLTHVVLVMTQLTGTVPAELFKLANLINFGISDCPGLASEKLLPKVVESMPQLELLMLTNSADDVNARIPTEISRLSNLAILYLEDWNLRGLIPSQLGQLTQLTALSLRENSLSGHLLPALSKLSKLTELDMSSNQLEDKLPPDLFSTLTALKWLRMNGNRFIGTIPSEIGLMSNLLWVQLQDTGLSGTLPTELLALTKLSTLGITNTSLSGSIPNELCGMMRGYERECNEGHGCFGKTTNTNVCQATLLCGCSCGPFCTE